MNPKTQTQVPEPKPAGYACPHCGCEVNVAHSSVVYSKSDYGMMHVCSNFPTCDSYVGCHKDTENPLGPLADSVTRAYRRAAHDVIDPLWKKRGWSRSKVYELLSTWFGKDFHVGSLTAEQCVEVIQEVRGLYSQEPQKAEAK